MGLIKKIDGGELRPGEYADADIVFVVVEKLVAIFVKGFHWDLHEGAIKVGSGEILAVGEISKGRPIGVWLK